MRKEEGEENGEEKREEEAKGAGAGDQLTPGGVFAGVGEFPSSHKPERTEMLQLPQLKYKAEAALRYVCTYISFSRRDVCLHQVLQTIVECSVL